MRAALRRDERVSSKRSKGYIPALVIFMYCVGSVSKTLPFVQALPLPPALRTNGFVCAVVLLLYVALKSRMQFLEGQSVRRYLPFIAYAITVTAIMSLVLYEPLGTLFSENAISATIPSYLWLVMVLLAVGALGYLFERISPNMLNIAFEAFIVCAILLGGLQAMSVLTGSSLYNAFNAFGLFQDIFGGRISTIGSEPSANGIIIGMISLPYVISRLAHGAPRRFRLYFVVLLILVGFVSSSQCYYSILSLSVGCLIVLRPKRLKRSALVALSLICCIACISFIAISAFGIELTKNDIVQQAHYYIIEKLGDSSNQSTTYRLSTMVNDIFVFERYPVFGVGDGLQGFYFNENIAEHWNAGESIELENALAGKVGLVGSGSLITGLLSSFGAVGIALFARALFSSIRDARARRKAMGSYYEMFLLGLFAMLPAAVIGLTLHGGWSLYLILAMPFMAFRSEREEGQ